jgi:uncharacterized membrane-anchored protein YhcB (DUF1043 family)
VNSGLSTKTLAMLLVGVIIGSAVGYFGNTMIMDPRINDLQSQINTLEEEYSELETDLEELTSDNADLDQQLETLQNAYSELQTETNDLSEENMALIEQIETLEALYESLLEDYQKNLGGLDFSNQSIQVFERYFTWSYGGETYTISIDVPEPMYEYYSSKERYHTSDYRGYILHPYDDKYIATLLWEFSKISALKNLTHEEELGLVISFVQSLHYLTDESTNFDEYPKFPVETLVDGGGDCEDTSIILAHLLEAMGIDVALLTLPNHMAIGVAVNATGIHIDYGNSSYYYLETTATGWEIGEVPPEHEGKDVTIDVVENTPFLMHRWEAKRNNNIVDVTITYTNESPIVGSGYRAWVGIELESGELYNDKIGSELDLGFGVSKDVKITIEGKRHDTMRLVVGVLTPDGEVITKKYSEYFTTR